MDQILIIVRLPTLYLILYTTGLLVYHLMGSDIDMVTVGLGVWGEGGGGVEAAKVHMYMYIYLCFSTMVYSYPVRVRAGLRSLSRS